MCPLAVSREAGLTNEAVRVRLTIPNHHAEFRSGVSIVDFCCLLCERAGRGKEKEAERSGQTGFAGY